MLTRLIYASTATEIIETSMIEDILRAARDFNVKNDITGMLCEGSGRFLQYIEGDRAPINELYCRILNDRRHKNVVLLDYSTIEKRAYSNWGMGFVSVHDPKVRNIVSTLSATPVFRPEDLTSLQAIGLVTALKSQLTQIAL